MSETFELPEYYTVNDRPVKVISTSDGGLDVLVMNWQTGEFERNIDYLPYGSDAWKDIDKFSEEQFNQYVEQLRREIFKKKHTP